MMDRDPSRSASPSSDKAASSNSARFAKPASPADAAKPVAASKRSALRDTFSRERFAAFAQRVGLARLAQVPGIGWVIGIAALALLIQGVGLANLVAVNEDKQKWEARVDERERLLQEIAALETRRDAEVKQLDARREEEFGRLESKRNEINKELATITGMIKAESERLAKVQGELVLVQKLRDEAQREQGAASNDASRLREANETIATQTKELVTQHTKTAAIVAQLEAEHQRLAGEVDASKKMLEDHRAQVGRAQQHVNELDAKAAATLEAIRQSREAQLKAQAQLDESMKLAAKAGADAEAQKVRLAALEQDIAAATASLDALHQQQTSLKAALDAEKKLATDAADARIKAEAELAAITDKLDKATTSLSQKQGAAAAEESLITAAQTRSEALKSRIANLQAELKPLEEQRLALEADIAGKRKELDTLRQRIDSARIDAPVAPPVPEKAPEKQQDKSPDEQPAEPAAGEAESSDSKVE